MTHILGDIAFAAMAGLSYFGGVWLSVTLAVVIFVSLLGAVVTHGERFDSVDRMALCGLAGSMLLTTASLWTKNSPYADWSFNLSRFFLAVICVKRFLIPVYFAVFTRWRVRQNARHQMRNVL